MTPFDAAWSIIKAFPRESLYTQSDIDDVDAPLPSGYGRLPFRSIYQTRHKTMHPAIQGMMDRVEEKTGPHSPRGRITDDDRLSYYQRILDVPTLDEIERDEGTSAYLMQGRADNNPQIASFARRGSMEDPEGYMKPTKDYGFYRHKESPPDTLNLKDMSGNLDFMNPKSEYEDVVNRRPDGTGENRFGRPIRFPGYDDEGYFIF